MVITFRKNEHSSFLLLKGRKPGNGLIRKDKKPMSYLNVYYFVLI